MNEKQYLLIEVAQILHVEAQVLASFTQSLRVKLRDPEMSADLLSEYEIKMFMCHILHVEYAGLDTLTNCWLQQHDPYYRDDRKNKRKKVEYSYETSEQQRRRKRQEFSFSSLYLPQLYELKGKQLDVDYYIKDLTGADQD